MKRFSLFALSAFVAAAAFAGTPTLDGIFDGESAWGTPVYADADQDPVPGAGWNGANATALYITHDATYAYLGAAVTGVAGWESFGFAIQSKSGGGNVQDPWGRQINFNYSSAPDFIVRGNFGGWTELRTWNGTDFNTGGGTSIGDTGDAASTTAFVEVRIPRSTLSGSVAEVTFFITGDNNSHGLFDAVPYSTDITTDWNQPSPNVLTTASDPTFVPVTMSGFTID